MKLTTEQIDQLFTFTRQHYVEWYDLQSELVDHLANAIETQWQENPKLTFDEVLNKEFGKFGVFGFMGVVEERQKFLGKKYNRLIWKYYKEFFRLPKIILTTALIYGLYTFLNFFENPAAIFMGTYIFTLIVSFVLFLKARKELKQKQKRTGKKWLFENNENSLIAIQLFILGYSISNTIIYVSKINIWHREYSIIASSVLVLITLYIFIQLKIIPNKVSEELAKTYPEYKLEKL
ncbi:hypothetical protein [Flavobacterium sp.]|uniref:hypothetical protein n=1 Tax=Flavobacterium sp. TaxID=239 RepID=UPI00379A196E